jgi:hypothetical protein
LKGGTKPQKQEPKTCIEPAEISPKKLPKSEQQNLATKTGFLEVPFSSIDARCTPSVQ